MKFSNLPAFIKYLEEGLPAFCYLLLSKEGRDNTLAKEEVQKKVRLSFPGIAEIKWDSTLTLSAFNSEVREPSFLEDKKLILIRDVEKLSKEIWTELLTYIGDRKLFFILEGSSSACSYFKECEKKGVVLDLSIEKSWEKERTLKKWAESLLAKEKKSIDPRAISFLVAGGEIDYSEIYQEIQKLIIFTEGKNTITLDDVERIIPYRKSHSPYLFSDAIFSKDSLKARLEIALRLEEDPLIMLLKQLRSQFQTTLKAASIYRNSGSREEITAHFPYMKGTILEKQMRTLQKWSFSELVGALLVIDEIEMMTKQGFLDETLLSDLLLCKIL